MSLTTKIPVLLAAIVIAAFECVALVVYSVLIGISYVTNGTTGVTGSDVAPWSLIAVFIGFAALIALIVRGLLRGNGSARTPFLVTQAFAIVVGQTLISGSEDFEKVGGWVLVIMAVVGAVLIMNPRAARGLNIQR